MHVYVNGCNPQHALEEKPYLSSKLCFTSKQKETWIPHSKRLVFTFGLVDGSNGVENMMKRLQFLFFFQLLFSCRSSAISHTFQIPHWMPRLGDKLGCENSLSYAILEIISTCHMLCWVSFLLEYQRRFSWFCYHAVYNKWFTSYCHIGPSFSLSTAVPEMTWLDTQQTA